MELQVTDNCNNHCTFCNTGWDNRLARKPGSLPREVLTRELGTSFQRGARRVTFQGGEPTLREDLDEIAAEARGLGFEHVLLFTNGRVAATAAGARRVTSFAPSAIKLSIQGGTAASHDASVQAKGAFRQTIAGVRRLVGEGRLVLVNSVLTTHLVNDLDNYVKLLIDLRPGEISFDTVKPLAGMTYGWLSQIGKKLTPGWIPRPEEVVAFRELSPPMSSFGAPLRDAILALRDAGIPTWLSSFPPCLMPGREDIPGGHEPATTLLTAHNVKRTRTRADNQDYESVKAPLCTTCAYDADCVGLRPHYARAHGFSELKPLAERRPHPGAIAPGPAPVDIEPNPLAEALQAAFVEGASPLARAVEPNADGRYHLRFASPFEDLEIFVEAGASREFYKRTPLFSVGYEGSSATTAQLDLVDRVVARLDALASELGPLIAPS